MEKTTLLFCILLGWASGAMAQPFITTWKTDNSGTSNNDQITIPTTGSGYNYTVNWGDGNTNSGVTGDITHTYSSPGTYTVEISGDFPRIYFNDPFVSSSDAPKLLTIEQWGSIAWESMQSAFAGCENLTYNATDAPDLSGVTSMQEMFRACNSFNGNLNNWDVSNVTDMRFMFLEATSFNQPLDTWDVSSVTDKAGLPPSQLVLIVENDTSSTVAWSPAGNSG